MHTEYYCQDTPRSLQSIKGSRHTYVHEHEIRTLPQDSLNSLFPVDSRRNHIEAGVLQHTPQLHLSNTLILYYDHALSNQNRRGRFIPITLSHGGRSVLAARRQ